MLTDHNRMYWYMTPIASVLFVKFTSVCTIDLVKSHFDWNTFYSIKGLVFNVTACHANFIGGFSPIFDFQILRQWRVSCVRLLMVNSVVIIDERERERKRVLSIQLPQCFLIIRLKRYILQYLSDLRDTFSEPSLTDYPG